MGRKIKLYFSENAKNLCDPEGKGNETKCSMKCIDEDYDDRLVFKCSPLYGDVRNFSAKSIHNIIWSGVVIRPEIVKSRHLKVLL